ncbi:MAG: GumC family protein [Elainellaceae cyanobacterium]
MASELRPASVNALPLEQDHEGGLRLDHFVSALKRQALIIIGVTTVTASAAVLKAVTDVPVYQAGFELLTPPVTVETEITSALPDALQNQSEIINVAIDETQIKILTSPRVMEPIVEDLERLYPNVAYGEIVDRLSISPSQAGDVLTVTYRNQNPQKVEDVLEVVSAAYLRYSLEDRQNNIYRGIDFLDEQLPVLEEQVEKLESELENLRQRSNLIDPLVQGEQLSQQAAKFTAEQLDLRVRIEQTEQLYQSLQRDLSSGNELAANSALSESARYQGLLDQLVEIDSELANELSLYLEDSPEVGVIGDRRNNIQPLLEREGLRVQQEIASRIREMEDYDLALSEAIETLNQRINQLSTVTRQYNGIQRELDIATGNLNQFLTRREALRINAAQSQTPWEILTPISNPQASAASAKRNLILGTVLGLLLGSGAAILIDRLKGKIYTIEELKEAAPLPILGNIPHSQALAEGRSLLSSVDQPVARFDGDLNGDFNAELTARVQREMSTPFLEAFRILSTGIRLSNPDNPIKSFAISSPTPGAGKSTISFYLAHAMASMGQQTLLVDTDLRRPSLHHLFGLPGSSKGLSSYIAGEFDLADVLIDSPLSENLFFVPAGPVPPDPLHALSAQRMGDFLKTAHNIFDVIIFDTPPLLGFADALTIAAKTQGLLLTARLGHVKHAELQSALDELAIAKIPIIGMVGNGAKQESRNTHSYYHYNQEESVESQVSYENV